MILRLEKIEMAVLIVHMSIMRKNVRKGFKSNYGKQEGKEMLKHYDSVKEALEREIEPLEQDHDETDVHFDAREIDMACSFIDFYVPELEKTLNAAGTINKEDQGHLETLQNIKNKIEQLKVNHE